MSDWSKEEIVQESGLCDEIIEAGIPALHALSKLHDLTAQSHNGNMDEASCGLNDAIDAVILVLAAAVNFQKAEDKDEGGTK